MEEQRSAPFIAMQQAMRIPTCAAIVCLALNVAIQAAAPPDSQPEESTDARSRLVHEVSVEIAPRHEHLQDLVAMAIAVCSIFCSLLAFVILKKPLPRIHDALPREPLGWSHADHLFVFTDLETDSIMIKNAGLADIDLSGCKLRVEHSQDRGIYYNFSFPEGYLLVSGTTVSVCYRTAAKFVTMPRRPVERLDSRTCPRLRWPPHHDGPVDSSLDSAGIFDRHKNQIACESAVLQPARLATNQGRRSSTDSSDAAFFAHINTVAPIPADWY